MSIFKLFVKGLTTVVSVHVTSVIAPLVSENLTTLYQYYWAGRKAKKQGHPGVVELDPDDPRFNRLPEYENLTSNEQSE